MGITVDTKAYGPVEIDERQCIKFPQGLYGFEGLQEYALLDARQAPFYWLQSLEEKNVAFVLVDPKILRADYDAALSPGDLEFLNLSGRDDENYLEFAIVTIPAGEGSMTVNLQGPLVINRNGRLGAQFISPSEQWHVRHNLLEEMAGNV